VATGQAAEALIRAPNAGDHDAIWAILEPVIRAGETLAVPRDYSREQALALWLAPDRTVRLLEEDGIVLGIFYIRANQQGGGAHVANAGYVTATQARGRGVARRMCAASLDLARTQGYRAMQFNFVISTNSRAVELWQAMGFSIVGRLPAAFNHPTQRFVDAYVMHRTL
jgi:L-amino acid N-acyltransferase YncA